MRAEEAQSILRSHGLIDRRTSKHVLNAIVLGRDLDLSRFDEPGIKDRITNLRNEYWRLRGKLPRTTPRNLPFYMLIKDRYRNFDWQETEKGTVIDFHFKGIKPSLLSLLTGIIPSSAGTLNHRFHRSLERLDPAVASALLDTLREAGFVDPSEAEMSRVVDWLDRALAGEPSTIVSPVCPDYAVEDGNAAKHRFTFRGVNSGIGVTASRLFDALPLVSRLLRDRLGLDVTHYVCPGDFEGFSEETNRRLGTDEATFLDRLAGSRQAILDQAPAPVASCFFTELGGGKEHWLRLHADLVDRINAGEFGQIVGAPLVREVALGRRGLYDRWYNVTERPAEFYEAIVIRQGAEYAAMGAIVSESDRCPNPLVLGADDHKMAPFYRLAADIPVLYLRRNYE